MMFIFQKGNDAFAAEIFYSVLFEALYFITHGRRAEKRMERYNRIIFAYSAKQSETRKTNCTVKRINLVTLIKEINEF